MRYILVLFIALILSSCSMDNMFLHPTVLAKDTKQMPLSSNNNIVTFSGDNHQPTFLNQAKDTLPYIFTVESVMFKSESGNMLNGWMLKPKGYKPTTTILHFHGNAGCLLSQYELIAPLLQNGFQVFMFDYSGFGFSEGKAKRKNVLKDGLSALDYLINRSDVSDTKLVIYGQSLGGNLSGVVAVKRQSDIDALVIEGAFSGHKDIAKHYAGSFAKMFVSEKYSSAEYIKDFNKPILVIHSTEDEVVPFVLGKKIYESANEPKEFFEIEKPHIQGNIYYSEEIAKKINLMLKN